MPDSTDSKPEDRVSKEAIFFQSPWTEETRKTKRNLLLAATAGLAASAAGIMPKEINAFGLKVEDIDQTAFLILLSLVIGYLLVTFMLAVYSDFMRSYWDELNKFESFVLPEDDALRDLVLSQRRVVQRLKGVHIVRVAVDVAIPVIVGIMAIIWLICKL